MLLHNAYSILLLPQKSFDTSPISCTRAGLPGGILFYESFFGR